MLGADLGKNLRRPTPTNFTLPIDRATWLQVQTSYPPTLRGPRRRTTNQMNTVIARTWDMGKKNLTRSGATPGAFLAEKCTKNIRGPHFLGEECTKCIPGTLLDEKVEAKHQSNQLFF